jgi:alcohol dehydrogenase class IV
MSDINQVTGFEFRTPGTIFSGPGSVAKIGDLRLLQGARHVLLVTDEVLAGLGFANTVCKALREKNIDTTVFDAVEPEPTAKTVRTLVSQLADANVDAVIGLGGGSPMDVAKLAAFLLNSSQELEEIYGVGLATGERLPVIMIPTTAGTGSEVTSVAVVTADSGDKAAVLGPQFLADAAILDAVLTLGLPHKTTAATGVDAMVHAIEAYTSGVRKNPASDGMALQAMSLLYANIRKVIEDGADLGARHAMLNGSMLAGLAFANATVGAVHALAYPIGGLFHVSHGGSNAVVLTPVMRFNLPMAAAHYAEIARFVMPELGNDTDDVAANTLIETLGKLVPAVGLEDRLSDFGIVGEDVSALCEGALRQARLLSYNIRNIESDDISDIYRQVL